MEDIIILIGFMGSGKSSVGRVLARKLGYKLVDSDKYIEKQEGKSINDIFKEYGEQSFRDMETEFLKSLLTSDEKIILSTGGGMPCHNNNAVLLKEIGFSVYLAASPSVIYERVKYDTGRPLLKVDDKLGKITSLLAERENYYKESADRVIDTDNLGVNEIADEIIRLLKGEAN
ncbi:MAG: shikimate kinase [Lachnospiraceae bacterium]|nr:shikimate kinase [Lachnospiraceae bacterium]